MLWKSIFSPDKIERGRIFMQGTAKNFVIFGEGEEF